MRYIVAIFVALGLGLAATALSAAPKTIKDCEKIAAADAYNRCLAMFGPVAHEHHLGPVPAGVDGHAYAYRHRRRHGLAIMRHGRRKRVILD